MEDSKLSANVESRLAKKQALFTLQWHLTARCEQQCLHCYMREESTYEQELQNELSFEDCRKVIDDFSSTFATWGMSTQITFTGGDPLLRPDLFDLISYAAAKGSRIGILGNPNLLDYPTAKRLKRLGVSRYSIELGWVTRHP